MAHLDGRSARFSLSICGFLSPPPLSDFPSCAPATPVSQTRGSHRRWPPLFPSTCNFQFDFAGRVPAVAIPNARNFREWAPPAGKYSSIHEAAPNLEPFANLDFTRHLHHRRLHRAATRGLRGQSHRRRGAVPLRSCFALFRFQAGPPMSAPEQKKRVAVEDTSAGAECRAELIFYARISSGAAPPVAILGQYACDFRRPDWEHRWTEWNSGQNPYLHLFLCSNHARALGLISK